MFRSSRHLSSKIQAPRVQTDQNKVNERAGNYTCRAVEGMRKKALSKPPSSLPSFLTSIKTFPSASLEGAVDANGPQDGHIGPEIQELTEAILR
jgi:hypothetical protein